jgi:hypothetical protein
MNFAVVKSLLPSPARQLVAHIIKRKRGHGPRYYIPQGKSVEEFFHGIQQTTAKYVVMRWFETLPHVDPGEDIDMLVSDQDLPLVLAQLDRHSGSIPCDIYTVGGLSGTRYKGYPYFPLALGEMTIKRREVRLGTYQVPNQLDYFHGLAYHAVYQKGPASGIPSGLNGIICTDRPEHDYSSILSQLRDDLGLDVPINLVSLDAYLADQGYRPSDHILMKLSKSNQWIKRRFFSRNYSLQLCER